MPLLSVIIPMYNAETTISRCVDSIFSKISAKDRNQLEVLLIDDGSTDNTSAVCEEIAKNNQQVFLFKKENGGVSSARNFGIENANGEWLVFVDSDDYFSENGSIELLEICNRINSDLCIYSMLFYYNSAKKDKCDIGEIDSSVIDYLKSLPQLNGKDLMVCSVCSKLYKTSIIKNNDIRFLDISYGEDFSFNLEYLKYINHVKSVNSAIYIYDCTTTNSGVKRVRDNFDFMLQCMTQKANDLIDTYDLKDTKTHEYFTHFIATCWLYVSEICFYSNLPFSQKKSYLKRWYAAAPKEILQIAAIEKNPCSCLIRSYLNGKSMSKCLYSLYVKSKWIKIKSNIYYFLKK